VTGLYGEQSDAAAGWPTGLLVPICSESQMRKLLDGVDCLIEKAIGLPGQTNDCSGINYRARSTLRAPFRMVVPPVPSSTYLVDGLEEFYCRIAIKSAKVRQLLASTLSAYFRSEQMNAV
jgi:hypothetical protein